MINAFAEAPPKIEPGVTKSAASKGDTVRAFCPTPVAVTLAGVSVVTSGVAAVLMVKVAVVAPAGTVTLAGTFTKFGKLLLKLTTVPPGGAGFANVTVADGASPFTT
jgi:hypothetical protein